MCLKGLIAAAFGSSEPLMDPSAPSLHRKCTDSLIYKKSARWNTGWLAPARQCSEGLHNQFTFHVCVLKSA